MEINYWVSLFMLLAGLILRFYPSNWSNGNIGIKTPTTLKSNSKLKEGNRLLGKMFIIWGPLSALICFCISISSLNQYITIRNFYYKFTVLIILILFVFVEIHIKKKD